MVTVWSRKLPRKVTQETLMAAKKIGTTNTSSSAAVGKSKVISSSTGNFKHGGGKTKMFGKQTVKAAKAR